MFSWALLFKDADGARRALGIEQTSRRAIYQNVKDLPPSGLGDDGYGMQGLHPSTGQEVTVYVWRVNKVILACHFIGKPGALKASDVLAVAAKMHAHTK